jgi:multiple sugar transport system permease protein
MTQKTREALTAYAFLAPFVISLAIFFGFAFARTVYFSLTDYDLFKTPEYVGLSNYTGIVSDPRFRIAFTNTVLYSVIVTVAQTIGAMLLAIVLNNKLRGMTFFRTAYYMPSIASSVVTTLVFIWLFRPTGIIAFLGNVITNHAAPILVFVALTMVLQAAQVAWERSRNLPAGVMDPALLVVSLLVAFVATWLLTALGVLQVGDAELRPLEWLSTRDRWLSLIPYPLLFVIVQNVFTTIPTLMLFFLAGLQGISPSLYEAAAIDGTTPWQAVRFITVPMLRPVTFYAVTVSLIGTLQMFDQVSILQGIAPLESTITLAFYVYNNVFSQGTSYVGLASAAAIMLGVLTITVVLLQRRFVVSDEGSS